MSERFDILIVGGGIAGLSTACHLAEAGATSIALVDRELVPGFYASGHNAGIARQLTGRMEHSRLAVRGRNRLAEAGLLAPTGGLLLAAEAPSLDALEAEAHALGLAVQRGAGPGLPGLRALAHLAVPSDGVIDVHGLLGHCARRARELGAALRYGCAVEAIVPLADGFEVQTSDGLLRAGRLVNAAGAWAPELGRRAGGLDLELKPMRRHLAWSDLPWPQDAPWAWWVDRPLYLRAESGGVLLCPCDESQVEPPPPGIQPDTDPTALDDLCEQLTALAPELMEAPIARAWSGLRTFSPDRRFVIGPDPLNPRLFWVAALGGHGMTTGLAVGELAARLLLEGGDHELAPGRFVRGQA
ncbi:MAG TPA: FAD-dependent oxidoreductase [Holophagaceae bacterium]|nr:FAD-dependent oxidoreductase [Holophagaceae bacterium]